MSLRDDLKKLAAEKPELRKHLLPLLRHARRPKQAGGFSLPLFEKLVTPRVIQNAMKREGGFTMDFFDFRKIQFDTVDPAAHSSLGAGLEAIWRVFPKGEFDNRESEYAWGTVQVYMKPTPKGISVSAHLYLKV